MPTKANSEGIEVKCHRCKHKWTYTGKKRDSWSVTMCPVCRTTVSLKQFLEAAGILKPKAA